MQNVLICLNPLYPPGIENMVPTIPSLKKISLAFGITLSQLLAEGDTPVSLTEDQRKLLERWAHLSKDQQEVLFALIDKMHE